MSQPGAEVPQPERKTEIPGGADIPVCTFVYSGASPRTLYGALPGGELVHVDNALSEQSLVCPDCGGDLIPVRGDLRVHHFRHRSEQECRTAGETAIHQLAKKIILSGARLLVPEFEVTDELTGVSKVVRAAREVRFHDVEEEVWEKGIRPDLIGVVEVRHDTKVVRRRLIIEICVTHRVGKEKLDRLVKRGESVLEIDLSRIDRNLTEDDLAVQVLQDAPRSWLHHREKEREATKFSRSLRSMESERRQKRRYAEMMSSQEEAVRRTARLREPLGASADELSHAQSFQRLWSLLDMSVLMEPVPEGDIFEVESAVWLCQVFSPLAVWNGSRCVAPVALAVPHYATKLARAFETRGWVKREFHAPIKIWTNNRSRDWDPAAETIERVIVDRLSYLGYGSIGSPEVDMQSAAKHALDAWKKLLFLRKKVLELEQTLAAMGMELRLNGEVPTEENFHHLFTDRPPEGDQMLSAILSFRELLSADQHSLNPAEIASRLERLGVSLTGERMPNTEMVCRTLRNDWLDRQEDALVGDNHLDRHRQASWPPPPAVGRA